MKRDGHERVEKRVEALSSLHRLAPDASPKLLSLLASLADEHSPTAVKESVDAVDVHIADALTGLEIPMLSRDGLIVDIGSGCGIPGLVLAAALPGAEVVAVEASRRRCDFIAAAASRASLGNVSVVCARVEEWREGVGVADTVVSRALSSLAVVLEYSAPLLREGGASIAWKGTPDPDELRAAAGAAAELGMSAPAATEVQPWASSGVRQLFVSSKVGPTPDRFPRRAGMAAKRPLGA